MQQWFYEMYGFYPLQMDRGVFYMDQVKYELIPIVDDEPWGEYEQILHQACTLYGLSPVTIIKNRMNQYVSSYDALNYILVAGQGGPVSVSQILALHEYSRRLVPVDLPVMKTKWIARVDQMEYEILPWLPPATPDFDRLVVATYVGLGLAENAIQYLGAIPSGTLSTCLCNKRIDALDRWVICNPTRVIFDHPFRDIAELLKLGVMTQSELLAWIELHGATEAELSYLVARLLYPFQLFDHMESLYTEERSDLGMDLEKYEEEVKRILHLVKDLLLRYSLRPIEWILLQY